MRKNKLVLEHCPNFYRISNFEFMEDDYISAKLIDLYKNYIFNIDLDNNEEVQNVEKIDFVLNKYIEDYLFRRSIKNDILNIRVSSSNFLQDVIEKIIDAFDNYESGYTRNIYFARWI